MGRLSSVSLPPQVEGAIKGTLLLHLGPVAWEEPPPRPEGMAVSVRWWGDSSAGDLLHPSPLGAAVRFQLRSGPKYIARYLQDVGTLPLVLKQPSSSATSSSASGVGGWAILGTASVGLDKLGVGTPLSGTFPVVGDQGRIIGQLPVSLSLDFSHPGITSFELNEHLAAEAAAAEATAAASAMTASLTAAPGVSIEQAADGMPAAAGGLRCPDTVRQLELAIAGHNFEERLANSGIGQADVLSTAAVERLLRQLLPAGTGDGPIACAAAVLTASQTQNAEGRGLDISTLVEAISECASLERSMAQDAGGPARQLRGLVGLLSSRHLEVAKAFSDAGDGREEGVTYSQLVDMLRTLSPGVTAHELRILLMVLAGLDEAGAARVTLPMLKQAVAAISFAQAYPTVEELARQEAAAAARREKAAAAAAASAADLASRAAAESRRRQAVGKLRANLQQGRAGKGGSQPAESAPTAHAAPAAAPHLATGGVTVPGPGAVAAVGHLAQPPGVPQLISQWVPGHGQPVGGSSGQAQHAGQPLAQQGQVVGWPAPTGAGGALQQPVAVGVPVQQPWQLPPLQQPAVGQLPLPSLSDPLAALINQAEQLQLALGRAAGNSSHGYLGGTAVGGGMGAATQLSNAYGMGLVVPVPSAGLPSLPANLLPTSAMPPSAAGLLAASAAPAAAAPAAVGADGHLSAASAALVEAAKALAGATQNAPPNAAFGPTAACPSPSPAAGARRAAGTSPAPAAGSSPAPAASPRPASAAPNGLELGLPREGPPDAELSDLSFEDPAELAEDIILQELFFSRPAHRGAGSTAGLAPRQLEVQGSRGQQAGPATQAAGSALPHSPSAASPQQGSAPAAEPPALPGPQLVLSLRLGALRLQQQQQQQGAEEACGGGPAKPQTISGSRALDPGQLQALASRAVKLRGVVKQLHPSARPLEFFLAASRGGSEGHGGAGGALPGVVRFGAAQASQVQLEVAVPQPCVEQGRLPSTLFIEVWDQASKLVGVVRAPLCVCHLAGLSGADLPALACEGRWDVWNVLEGRAEGSMEVFAVLQEKGQERVVPAVQHGFSVTIQTAYRLPGSVAYAEAELRCPDSRYIKYTFPGEPEPLFTKDVPIMSNPTFDATAHHSVTLPTDQDITAVLTSLGSRRLRFEVWDQWVDGKQELQSWAEMPMSELASLARTAGSGAIGAPGEKSGGAMAVAFHQVSRLLPLVTEFDGGWPGCQAGAAPAKGPAIRVDLAYHAERVLAPAPAPEEPGSFCGGRAGGSPRMPLAPAGAAPASRHGPSTARSGVGGAAASPGAVAGLQQQQHAQQMQQPRQQPAVKAGQGRGPAAAPNPSAAASAIGELNAGMYAADGIDSHEDDAGAENNVLLANCSPLPTLKAVPAAEPKGVEAVLCVEVIQACGLAAAVREACAFSSSNAALNRALKVGAHPFARLALFPSDPVLQKRAPPLQTPFQAQTFCPKFLARHEYRLRLDARALQALAEKELLVEVWHHLPRSQAVAAALSAGRSSHALSSGGAGSGSEREVLLGSASGPLLEVLCRPQGFRGWLGLKSQRGEAVGAVQLAIHLSELQGLPVSAAAPDKSPLHQCQALSGTLPSSLGWLLRAPGTEAFRGQRAAATVEVLEVSPPREESSGRDADRPKAELYYATYRLPGAACSHSTVAKSLTAGAGQGPAGAAAALSGRAWSAKLGHVGTFQVAATAALRKALASSPLAVSVYRQPAASGSKPGRAPAPPALVGTAEVDLSGLLWAREPGNPTVMGSFLLIDPSAKSLGGARVRLRVFLDLFSTPPAQQAPGAGAVGTDRLEGVWELEGEEGPMQAQEQQQQQQHDHHQQQHQQQEQEEEVEGEEEQHQHHQQELEEERRERHKQQHQLPRVAGLSSAASHPLEPEHTAAAGQPAVGAGRGGLAERPRSMQRPAAEAETAAERDIPPPGGVVGSDGGCPIAGNSSSEGLCSIAAAAPAAEEPAAPAQQCQSAPSPPAPAAAAAVRTHGGGSTGSSSSGAPSVTGQAGAKSSPTGPTPTSQPLSEGGAGESSRQGPSGPTIAEGGTPPPPPGPRPSGQLLIHIEKAVHLPPGRPGPTAGLLSTGGGSGSSSSSSSSSGAADGSCRAYVSLTWGPQKLKRSTAAVEVRGAGGAAGGTAIWEELIEVEADASAFPLGASSSSSSSSAGTSEVPGSHSNAGARGKGPTGGPILLLNVWSCPSSDGSQQPEGLRPGSPSPVAAGAALVGCAAVDLTALPMLGEVRGYFNLVDYLQQVRGQLRLSVRPDEVLQQALQAARGRGPSGRILAGAGPLAQAGPAGEGWAVEQGRPWAQVGQQPAAAPASAAAPGSVRITAEARAAEASGGASSAAGQPAAGVLAQGTLAKEPVGGAGEGFDEEGEAGVEEEVGEGAHAASALMGELQARMQALQLLSQRLSSDREPDSRAEAAAAGLSTVSGGGSSNGSPQEREAAMKEEGETVTAGSAVGATAGVGHAGPGRGSEGGAPGQQRPQRAQQGAVSIRQIEESDEEGEGGGWFGLRLPPVLGQGQMAWSGSDSEEDVMAMVGISFEGAVSEEDELDHEALQREAEQQPRRPSLLMADDWMFDISRPLGPSQEEGGSGLALEQQQQQQAAGERETSVSAGAPRRISFQNVLLPAVPTPSQSELVLGWGRGQQAGAGGPTGSGPGNETEAAAGSAETSHVELPSNLQPLPVLPAEPRSAPGAQPAPARPPGAPAMPARVLGTGWGFASSRDGHDDWLFDISKPHPAGAQQPPGRPAMGGAPAAAAAPANAYHQYLVLQPGFRTSQGGQFATGAAGAAGTADATDTSARAGGAGGASARRSAAAKGEQAAGAKVTWEEGSH